MNNCELQISMKLRERTGSRSGFDGFLGLGVGARACLVDRRYTELVRLALRQSFDRHFVVRHHLTRCRSASSFDDFIITSIILAHWRHLWGTVLSKKELYLDGLNYCLSL